MALWRDKKSFLAHVCKDSLSWDLSMKPMCCVGKTPTEKVREAQDFSKNREIAKYPFSAGMWTRTLIYKVIEYEKND